jgi:hypothetical protein
VSLTSNSLLPNQSDDEPTRVCRRRECGKRFVDVLDTGLVYCSLLCADMAEVERLRGETP